MDETDVYQLRLADCFTVFELGEVSQPKHFWARFNNSCLIFEQWEQWLATAQWAVGSGEWAVGNQEWAVGSKEWAIGVGSENKEWARGSEDW